MGKTIMYERIYADLLAKIQNGDYQPGDRLPSEKESAELYGVSRITAKKAMDMLAKEKKISREPGRGSFVCSPAAAVEMKKESRGTANQRIGVIFDGFGSDFGTRLLQGIESECDRRQSDLLFKCTYGSIEKEKQAIDAAIRAGVKGILLLCAQGDNYNSKVLELALAGYPLVLVDRRMQGISIPCVRTDNYEAAKEVTKKLIAMGHEKICFLTHASVTTTTIHERYEGFVHCMLKYEDANGALAKLEKYNHIPETRIPMKSGCMTVAVFTRFPKAVMNAETPGPTNCAARMPEMMVTPGVTRISTGVSLETIFPSSAAMMVATSAPTGPPSSLPAMPTVAAEKRTSVGAFKA